MEEAALEIKKYLLARGNFIGVHKFIDGSNTMIQNRKDMISTQIIVMAILKEKNVLKNSFNYIELTKRMLKFPLSDNSNEDILFRIVSSHFHSIMVISKIILRIPIIGKIVVRHYL